MTEGPLILTHHPNSPSPNGRTRSRPPLSESVSLDPWTVRRWECPSSTGSPFRSTPPLPPTFPGTGALSPTRRKDPRGRPESTSDPGPVICFRRTGSKGVPRVRRVTGVTQRREWGVRVESPSGVHPAQEPLRRPSVYIQPGRTGEGHGREGEGKRG